MKLVEELYYNELAKVLIERLSCIDMDLKKQIDTAAVKALEEIKEVISNEGSTDFMTIERIMSVLEKYNIDTGNCHDF